MGLLDRFKKEPGPDALTWEAVARARAVAGVSGAEIADADTVHVTWTEHPGTTVLSLADVREEWTKASGFTRIELMDQVVAGLAPPATQERASDSATDGWSAAQDRLGVVVGRPGAGGGAVRWTVAGGVLEGRAVLDGADVAASDLERWGVGAQDVQAAALAALAGGDPRLDPIAPGQPAWVPTVPADHPPAWLAAPARLVAAAGLGSAVVLAPTPTELVVVDPEAHDLLASVLTGTRSIVADADEVLLAAPLLASPDGVVEWTPAADHPCAGAAADLRSAGP